MTSGVCWVNTKICLTVRCIPRLVFPVQGIIAKGSRSNCEEAAADQEKETEALLSMQSSYHGNHPHQAEDGR